MLTRLQPPASDETSATSAAEEDEDSEYDYSVAHIDKANVASYDYSSVLISKDCPQILFAALPMSSFEFALLHHDECLLMNVDEC